MKFSLIGNRDGKAAIRWPAVVVSVLIISALFAAGVAMMSLGLGWFSFRSFAILPIILCAILAITVERGLQLPPRDLPTIG